MSPTPENAAASALPLLNMAFIHDLGGKWSLKTNTECSETVCIYESLLFHPKIFSMSTYSKQCDMKRASQQGRVNYEGILLTILWCENVETKTWVVMCIFLIWFPFSSSFSSFIPTVMYQHSPQVLHSSRLLGEPWACCSLGTIGFMHKFLFY